MKTKPNHSREKEILEECLEKIEFAEIKNMKADFRDTGSDIVFEMSGPWGKRRYQAEVKLSIAPREARIMKKRPVSGGKGAAPILLTRFVNPGLGEVLRREGIEYVDTAGNMYFNTPPLFVDVTGKRPRKPIARPKRTFHTKAIQLIHAILRNPAVLNTTYREMARVANVALGSVGQTLDDLRQQGFMGRGATGQRILIDPERLLDRWEAAYLDVLRPSLLQTRARTLDGGLDQLRQNARSPGQRWMIGGELAASLVTRHLVPLEATVFFWADEKSVMKALGLIEDSKGPVYLLKAWSDALEPDVTPDGDPVTDPVLMHAELLREPDDRLLETASILLEEHIRPRLKK